MTFGERIIKSREGLNMSQKGLAETLGISPTRLNYWEKDKRQPDIAMIKALASALHVSADYLIDNHNTQNSAPLLSNEALHIAKQYQTLDEHGKEMVEVVIDRETARIRTEAEPARPHFITPYFRQPASAGVGQTAGEDEPENLHLTKEPPRGTSYVTTVSGDSMEPTYYDGNRLFIRAQVEIAPGQVGIFFMDGNQWVKELGDGVLLSHNPEYAPRQITEDIRCQGLVLGVCDESYLV